VANRASKISGAAPLTPLAAKLGIKADMSVALLWGPEGFADTLEPLPGGVKTHLSLRAGRRVELIVAFITWRGDLERHLHRLLGALGPDGVLWVAWPKKSSKVPTDVSDQVVRDVVLPTGWVDTKVCAIDATWSGLKMVLRRELRAAPMSNSSESERGL
jgi:hypothetical protein